MRIEKGHVSGNELNGQTSAADLGLGRMQSTKKDFIGRVLKDRPGFVTEGRPSLVGFKPVDGRKRLRAGAHFFESGREISVENDQGYMTSVAYSPSLAHWIGIGLIANGPKRIGERVRAYDPVRNGDFEVEICAASFIDPDGERLRG
jgi:glycine cleavage system aminomethyltransferase T